MSDLKLMNDFLLIEEWPITRILEHAVNYSSPCQAFVALGERGLDQESQGEVYSALYDLEKIIFFMTKSLKIVLKKMEEED